MEWEKIFANDATNKGSISKIYKQLNIQNNKNNPIKKMGRRYKQMFPQERLTDGQQACEKMLNVANYQRNANQNHHEASRHTGQNGHHPEVYK